MKPLGRKNYGSIPHLSTSKLGEGDHFIEIGQERILLEKKRNKHDLIYVFEKYDGSNVGVTKKDGNIYALTRAGYEAKTSKYRQHILFSEWVDKNKTMFADILYEDERICGEWMVQAHSLIYDIPKHKDPIVFFDMFSKNNDRMPINELSELIQPYPIELPRMLHCGSARSVESLLPMLNFGTRNYSVLGERPEGMVFRVENKGKVDFLAKWVRRDFEPGKLMIGKEEHELIIRE